MGKVFLNTLKIYFIKFERKVKDYFSAKGADIYTRIVRRLFLSFVIAGVIAFLSIITVLSIAKISYPKTKVPDVKEKDLISGIIELQNKKLNVRIEPVFNTNYQRFTIIDQHPSKGLTVRQGRTVTLIVSLGKDIYTVPDVVGLSREEVERLLTEQNIPFTITVIKDKNYPLNKVISQQPSPGLKVERSVKMNILVNSSIEADKYRVENFVNQPVENAVLELLENGIQPVIEKQVAKSIEQDGIVLGQSIPPDTIIQTSGQIKLYTGVYGESEEEILKANYHYFIYKIEGLQEGEVKEVRVVVSDERDSSKEIYNGVVSSQKKTIFTVFKSYGPTKLYLIFDNAIIKEINYE